MTKEKVRQEYSTALGKGDFERCRNMLDAGYSTLYLESNKPEVSKGDRKLLLSAMETLVGESVRIARLRACEENRGST